MAPGITTIRTPKQIAQSEEVQLAGLVKDGKTTGDAKVDELVKKVAKYMEEGSSIKLDPSVEAMVRLQKGKDSDYMNPDNGQ